MNRFFAAVLFLALFSGRVGAADNESFATLYEQMNIAAGKGDFLSLRILVIKSSLKSMAENQWALARELIHRNPSVGWDMLVKWDQLRMKGLKDMSLSEVNQRWHAADQQMTKGNFKASSKYYLQILEVLQQSDTTAFGDVNFFAEQTLLHSLARSLYGEGRFLESLKMYKKLTLLYPLVRQVQFEKMWAAFRAGNYSIALGAITSQMSSYFNRYLEPETYLVQYYLYRRMCRESDMKQVFASVLTFQNALKEDRYTFADWAAGDLETKILLRLTQAMPDESVTGWVTTAERTKESKDIHQRLLTRYQADLKRLQTQLEKVVAYLNMASVAAKSELPAISSRLDLKKILNTKNEMWPVEDAEDWLDEIGGHYFVGQSECK